MTHRNLGRRAALVTTALVLGVALSACGSSGKNSSTTTSSMSTTTSTTASGLGAIQQLNQKVEQGQKATFLASWTSTESGKAETITIAQESGKSYMQVTSSGSSEDIISTGTETCFCTGSSCFKESGTNPLAGVLDVYDGQEFLDTTEAFTAQAVLKAEGINLSFTSGTYAGQSSKCVDITKTGKSGGTATWCVSTANGLLTHWSADGNSFSLSSYSSTPPASDFQLPKGATMVSIP